MLHVYIYLQGLTSEDVTRVTPLVHPLLALCQMGDQGEQIQVCELITPVTVWIVGASLSKPHMKNEYSMALLYGRFRKE